MKTVYADASVARLMDDQENKEILLTALGIVGNIKTSFRHYFRAPASGQTLHRCHRLADCGLMYFCPGPDMLNLFLVTHAGASAVGARLMGEDARIMTFLATAPAETNSLRAKWKADLRHAQISGGPVPSYPMADLPKRRRIGADGNTPPYAKVA
jgi:hypothetical protein